MPSKGYFDAKQKEVCHKSNMRLKMPFYCWGHLCVCCPLCLCTLPERKLGFDHWDMASRSLM